MVSPIEQIRECLRDIDPEFVQSVAVTIAWEYSRLYDEVSGDPSVCPEYRNEVFSRRRALCAVKALCHAAQKHGVPFEFRRLDCNGQRKILLKIGRVVLIQEPMSSFAQTPQASDYKRELSESFGLIRQLELDLGDIPDRIRDWGGGILAVLLHGSAGPGFNRDDRSLGGLMLGVPDAGYTHWVLRLDLHRIAMHGLDVELGRGAKTDQAATQSDNVNVTLKSKRGAKKVGE